MNPIERSPPALPDGSTETVTDLPRSEQMPPLPPSKAREVPSSRKPDWIKIRPPAGEQVQFIKQMLRDRKLHTVCEEARCPNLSECWASGTATLMLGSEICTRACRFCAIQTSRTPPPLDVNEPALVAQSVVDMRLRYVVLTSVDRDDLEDQGSNHFAQTIAGIKSRNNQIIVEALVPDFQGDASCVQTIVDSGLDVYAHNIETVKRLQARVRDPRANYLQSLATLRLAKELASIKSKSNQRSTPLYTKSSIMVGLGETRAEINEAFRDLRQTGVDIVTLGQYLRPTLDHLPVESYWTPAQFEELREDALAHGFLYVASGAMVRSSYKASELFLEGLIRSQKNLGAVSEGKA